MRLCHHVTELMYRMATSIDWEIETFMRRMAQLARASA